MTELAPESFADSTDRTRKYAVTALLIGIIAISAGYASAFRAGGAPKWGAWLLALGIPISLTAIMVLGAARGSRGVGALKIPFAIVFLMLVVGFGAAISLDATEGPNSTLWLGLPVRAAIVIYGIGLLPIVILPIAYALTFATQTLDAADVERVRQLGRGRLARSPEQAGASHQRITN